jgi:hypothetical protein
MHVPYGAFFINKEFEFEFINWWRKFMFNLKLVVDTKTTEESRTRNQVAICTQELYTEKFVEPARADVAIKL